MLRECILRPTQGAKGSSGGGGAKPSYPQAGCLATWLLRSEILFGEIFFLYFCVVVQFGNDK